MDVMQSSSITVFIARKARVTLSSATIERVINRAVRAAGTRRRGELSIAFVGERRMRSLNRIYHGEDHVTDVLAFSDDDERVIGEIVVCPLKARTNARAARISLREELIRLLIHGTLHLLGHDHVHPKEAEKMFTLQERLVREETG
jgi:probable rRNA maturation factor